MIGSILRQIMLASGQKRGIACTDPSLPRKLNVGWYYNWSITPLAGVPNNIGFVPMIHGLADVGTLTRQVPIVLGFNEPSNQGPGYITVPQAIAAWPQVQSTAIFAGAPAIGSDNRSARAWLTAFMSSLQAGQLKVSFIPVHWYGPPDSKGLLAFVDSVFAQFGVPVWVTEFAVKNDATHTYTAQQALAYMQAVLPGLESRSFVERFSWFGALSANPPVLVPSHLVDDTGALTTLGQFYASFPESGAAPGRTP